MNILRTLFKPSEDVYPFTINKLEDGESIVFFTGKEEIKYVLDLEWFNGIFDIEFGVIGVVSHDTTNVHDQYKILRTINYIIRVIGRKRDIYIRGVRFRSSSIRAGKIDPKSCDIRNRFFIRFIVKEYPHSIISINENNIIEIKLK